MTAMARLSVVVITYNEERNIARCLESLAWADERIVVDSGSSDRTAAIAAGLGARVIVHHYDGDMRQRERGFDASAGEWLMYVDADEEVTPALAAAIAARVGREEGTAGYAVVRRNRIFGRWTERGGWFPDRTVRIFRRDARRPNMAEVHGGYAVAGGATGLLDGFLLHYTYDSIAHYIAKMNDYTSLEVSNKLRDNPRLAAPGPLKIVFSPFFHFFRTYVSLGGWRDGLHGFVLAVLAGLYALALYAKVWEHRFREREGGAPPPITNDDLRALRR